MSALDTLRDALPDPARDLKLNLQTVLAEGPLGATRTWGTALAVAAALRHPELLAAISEEARTRLAPESFEDALAAAAIMGMNNVFYRFRHMAGKPEYSQLPARLRMNRLAKPAASKLDFELYSLAVSAVNGCELCIQSHEAVLVQGGLTEAEILDAVRIAATLSGVAVALGIRTL